VFVEKIVEKPVDVIRLHEIEVPYETIKLVQVERIVEVPFETIKLVTVNKDVNVPVEKKVIR
jgi:hypothetical protein